MNNKFKPFDKVLVRNYNNEEWRPGFFYEYIGNITFSYNTSRGLYKQCILYEGNELLCNTNFDNEENKSEFKFGDRVKVWNTGYLRPIKAIFYKYNDTKAYPFRAISEKTGDMDFSNCIMDEEFINQKE